MIFRALFIVCVLSSLSSCEIANSNEDPPSNLKYPYSTLQVFEGYSIPPMLPSYQGKGDSFYSEPDLPKGLILDDKTGEISGKGVHENSGFARVVIGVKNNYGNCTTELKIWSFPLESEEETDRLGNKPKSLFWYCLTGCIVLLTIEIMFSVPYCICQRNRHKRIEKRKQQQAEVS